MNPSPARRGAASVAWCMAALSATALAIFLGAATFGQSPRTSSAGRDADAPKTPFEAAKYAGVRSCVNCHAQGDKIDPPQALEVASMEESCRWQNEDKHSLAYLSLESDLSRAIVKNLPQEQPGEANDATKMRACLNCHAVVVEDESRKLSSFRIEDGVSCDGCHGPAGEWFLDHTDPKLWRPKSGKDKFTQTGMIDVRDPVRRAAMCASCHVGNHAEGKVLTHEMYAAGHPPLPAFEVATFSDQLPRHWRSIDEKIADLDKLKHLAGKEDKRQVLQAFIDANALDEAEMSQTRLMLIGGVVAFRQAMELLAARIESGSKPAESASHLGPWPDYAQFECFACHHDLKPGDWRQKLGFSGPPGRVPIREWPFVLAAVAARVADEHGTATPKSDFSARLRKQRGAMTDSLHAQPFGRPDELRAAALALVAWADELLAVLPGLKYDPPLAATAQAGLADAARAGLRDYDTARQTAWALRVLHEDLRGGYDVAAEAPKVPPATQAALEVLDDLLGLTLPKRPLNERDESTAGCAAPIQEFVILKALPESLEVIARFDPTDQRLIDALAALCEPAKDADAAQDSPE